MEPLASEWLVVSIVMEGYERHSEAVMSCDRLFRKDDEEREGERTVWVPI